MWYYFSVNEAMAFSQNGSVIIEKVSKNRILTETDAPYNEKKDIAATLRQVGMNETLVMENFYSLLDKIR